MPNFCDQGSKLCPPTMEVWSLNHWITRQVQEKCKSNHTEIPSCTCQNEWKSLSHVQLFATPMDCIVHGILQARILEWVALPFSRSSQLRDWTQVSQIAGRFFTRWVTGKPKNTGVGSLSLLQGLFLTQESNWGLLHCRQILSKWAIREAHVSERLSSKMEKREICSL